MKIKTMNLAFYIAFILSIGAIYIISYLTNNDQLEDKYIKMEIAANETVWELAEKYAEDHNLTTWEFISWVEEKNKIDADNVTIGTSLFLPIEKKNMNDSIIIVADGER